MKELLTGIWILSFSILVSILILPIGFLYSFVYSIWLFITLKNLKVFFIFWIKLIDGIAAAIGNILFSLSYSLDLIWNVKGEIFEDIFTSKEGTEFGKKNTSVSESIGKLEIDGDLNIVGKKFSKLLNFFFNQKQHAIDSWNYNLEKKELLKKYFKK